MGFPKGASIPLCQTLISGGVNTPPAQWLGLFDGAISRPLFFVAQHKPVADAAFGLEQSLFAPR